MREARFGPFRLDLSRRELWHGEKLIAVGARAIDILCLLVAARGAVVSKDELMAKVWPGVIVEENNIQVHVSALRKAIAGTTDGQAFLVTVPGRGYRFIGLEPADQAPSAHLPDQPEHPPLPDKPSIAVLPFVNLGGDAEQEYFADGIAEDIITALARFRWFFVIARNSSFAYRGRATDVKQVARELGVRYVLEGSVRRSANRVRISAQLIDANAGTQMWGDRFDRELADIFAVQDEITEQVVGAIEPELLKAEGGRAVARPSGNLSVWT